MEISRELFLRDEASRGESEGISRPSMTYWQDAWRRLRQNKLAMAGLFILVVVGLMSIFAPIVSQYKFDAQDLYNTHQLPTSAHWFGTDALGRDMWVRVWKGGQVSLIIAVSATVIDVVIGALYGGISGYVGGTTDDVMMRIVELINGIPFLLVVILLLLAFGAGVMTIILAMALLLWTGMARLVRGQVLQLKEQEFVLAARTLGAKPMRIITQHLIPNAMGAILVSLTLRIPAAIFTEAILSFIGVGLQPPKTSWGVLANEGRTVILIFPHILIWPVVVIAVSILAFNLFGDGVRDALDPRLRGKQ